MRAARRTVQNGRSGKSEGSFRGLNRRKKNQKQSLVSKTSDELLLSSGTEKEQEKVSKVRAVCCVFLVCLFVCLFGQDLDRGSGKRGWIALSALQGFSLSFFLEALFC